MIVRTRLFATCMILLAAFAVSIGHASAATPPTAAKEYMHKLATVTLGILSNKGIPLTEREQKVRKLLGENLAVRSIGKFVVGKAWRTAPQEQRDEYQNLFEKYITLTYAKRLGGYAGEKFAVTAAKPVGKKNDALVTTKINRPSGPPLIAGWRIRESNGAFRILDVMVEGISMVVAQRSEFTSIIQKNGMQGLIEILRAKVTSFGIKAP